MSQFPVRDQRLQERAKQKLPLNIAHTKVTIHETCSCL